LRESVTAIFLSESTGKVFTIKRQDYLRIFPGYTSFPGGKVDKQDFEEQPPTFSDIPEGMKDHAHHYKALKREIEEELNFVADFEDCYLLAEALTPEFNPYRFNVFFYVVPLKEEIQFEVDEGEAEVEKSGWFSPRELVDKYRANEMMAVPPVIRIIEELAKNISVQGPIEVGLEYDENLEVPVIESIAGVRQFLPLSNTFPPANRTNCFIIGEEKKILIDPSPRDAAEYLKLKRSLDKVGFDEILITHHHSDHHEFLRSFVNDYGVEVLMSGETKRLMDLKFGKAYLEGVKLRILREGDIVTKSLGQSVSVIDVPGHDEGQIALKPENDSWVLVGDLIQTVGTVVIGDIEGDMAKYFESLSKVIKIKPNFCIPSHGIAVGGVHKLELTLTHRTMRESEILGLVERGKSDQEILDIVYAGLKERLIPYAKKTIEAHLVKLAAEGRIKR